MFGHNCHLKRFFLEIHPLKYLGTPGTVTFHEPPQTFWGFTDGEDDEQIASVFNL